MRTHDLPSSERRALVTKGAALSIISAIVLFGAVASAQGEPPAPAAPAPGAEGAPKPEVAPAVTLAAPTEKKPPKFSVTSGDAKFDLKLHAQANGRFFRDDQQQLLVGGWFLQSVRPIFDGALGKHFSFRVMPDFGQARVQIVDAYAEISAFSALKLRVGKTKVPLGLERWQGEADVMFIHRAAPTALVPNRDIGAYLHGDLQKGLLTYQAGFFNGVADGGSGDADNDDHFDVVGRVFVHPLRLTDVTLLHDVGLGFAAMRGVRRTQPRDPLLATYRTPAQQRLFGYNADGTPDGTAIGAGSIVRTSPQAYAYIGPVGLLGEFVRVEQRVSQGGTRRHLRHEAWQVSGSLVLTGEKASFKGVQPEDPFDLDEGHLGALELVARYDVLKLDKAALESFSNPTTSASGTRAIWLGFNWYLHSAVKLSANYVQAEIVDVDPLRPDEEKSMSLQTQVSF